VRCSVVRRYRNSYLPRGLSVFVTPRRFVLLWATGTGLVFGGRSSSFSGDTAESQERELWQAIWGEPMKRKDLKASLSAKFHADDTGLKESFPNLAEFMTAALFEGSKDRRESPTVTIWAAGGQWRASIKDRAEGLVLWLSAPAIGELLTMLEDFVLSADAPWRHDDQAHGNNGKRVKKGT